MIEGVFVSLLVNIAASIVILVNYDKLNRWKNDKPKLMYAAVLALLLLASVFTIFSRFISVTTFTFANRQIQVPPVLPHTRNSILITVLMSLMLFTTALFLESPSQSETKFDLLQHTFQKLTFAAFVILWLDPNGIFSPPGTAADMTQIANKYMVLPLLLNYHFVNRISSAKKISTQLMLSFTAGTIIFLVLAFIVANPRFIL